LFERKGDNAGIWKNEAIPSLIDLFKQCVDCGEFRIGCDCECAAIDRAMKRNGVHGGKCEGGKRCVQGAAIAMRLVVSGGIGSCEVSGGGDLASSGPLVGDLEIAIPWTPCRLRFSGCHCCLAILVFGVDGVWMGCGWADDFVGLNLQEKVLPGD